MQEMQEMQGRCNGIYDSPTKISILFFQGNASIITLAGSNIKNKKHKN
jgi:hypothetical protein